MKIRRELDNGKIMTLCVKCDHISHTYRGKCTYCGEQKEYDFFFSLPTKERENLLEILIEYNKQSE